MIRKIFFLMVFLLLTPTLILSADLTRTERRRMESDATDALKAAISLWKDEKFEEVYECGYRSNQTNISKESFVQRMKNKPYGLALSWETIQNVEADVISRAMVHVKAKIGYRAKSGGDTKFITETYQMRLEDNRWRINLSKFLHSPK